MAINQPPVPNITDEKAAPLAAPEPHPQATPPATPVLPPDDKIQSHDDAPASLANPTSHGKEVKGGPTQPSIDADKFDSAGAEKVGGLVGPRGENQPLDVMTDADRAAVDQKEQARLGANMAPTDHVDSRQNPKGAFKTIEQGFDKHGARIPDKVDVRTVVEAPPPQVGPRGAGAPQDCFTGTRPLKRE